MSGVDEFWASFRADLDAEAAAVVRAKRLKRLRVIEASLVDRGANQHARVMFWKSAEAKGDTDMDELERHLRDLEPGLDWDTRRAASYGAAIAKHATDPVVAALYEVVKGDEPAAIEKAAEQWEPASWRGLQRVAARLRAEDPGLSEAASIEKAYRLRPDLAAAYRLATME